MDPLTRRRFDKHKSLCKSTRCACKKFERKLPEYDELFPVDPEGKQPGTWLWFDLGLDCKHFVWVCAVCEASGRSRLSSKSDALVDVAKDSQECEWRKSNLLKHHRSKSHREAVAELLGNSLPTSIAPPLAVFRDIFKQVRKGNAIEELNVTFEGIVGKKQKNIAWCLSEADLSFRRQAIAESEVMQFMRDERRGRLHVRFLCVSKSVSSTETFGYLGQAQNFAPSAIGIAKATQEIYKTFCTAYLDPPNASALAPCFDKSLFEHMCVTTEAGAVDSAENEIVAGLDMSAADSAVAFTPNCRFILRDAAHSRRRVLSRLFVACKVLSDAQGMLVLWKDSLGQVIQHSIDIRQWYEKSCQVAADVAV